MHEVWPPHWRVGLGGRARGRCGRAVRRRAGRGRSARGSLSALLALEDGAVEGGVAPDGDENSETSVDEVSTDELVMFLFISILCVAKNGNDLPPVVVFVSPYIAIFCLI